MPSAFSTTLVFVFVVISGWFHLQSSPSNTSPLRMTTQEAMEKDRDRRNGPRSPQEISKAVERLRQAVNGHSHVSNLCRTGEHEIQVEETSEIREASGCKVVVRTVKTSGAGETQRNVRFTLRANLVDLTTPASIEALRLSDCRSEPGTLIKIASRAQPGKAIATTRVSTGPLADPEAAMAEQEVPPRKDLSFFFSSAELAGKAARALERAVAICGGEEWPDEDDLP